MGRAAGKECAPTMICIGMMGVVGCYMHGAGTKKRRECTARVALKNRSRAVSLLKLGGIRQQLTGKDPCCKHSGNAPQVFLSASLPVSGAAGGSSFCGLRLEGAGGAGFRSSVSPAHQDCCWTLDGTSQDPRPPSAWLDLSPSPPPTRHGPQEHSLSSPGFTQPCRLPHPCPRCRCSRGWCGRLAR